MCSATEEPKTGSQTTDGLNAMPITSFERCVLFYSCCDSHVWCQVVFCCRLLVFCSHKSSCWHFRSWPFLPSLIFLFLHTVYSCHVLCELELFRHQSLAFHDHFNQNIRPLPQIRPFSCIKAKSHVHVISRWMMHSKPCPSFGVPNPEGQSATKQRSRLCDCDWCAETSARLKGPTCDDLKTTFASQLCFPAWVSRNKLSDGDIAA
jgi:hypothetical protein